MPRDLPTYLLYADESGLPAADVMLAESIPERSRLHSWEIRPHRHEALFQIFHVRSGSVDVLLDGDHHALRGPGIITVMPLSAHGFRWSSDVTGSVFTILEAHVRHLLAPDIGLRDSLLQSRCARIDAAHRRSVNEAAAGLSIEYGQTAPWRPVAIDAALLRLLVAIGRGLPVDGRARSAAGDRALAHVQRLRALVDERFREQPTLREFAATIGISTAQLNRACRAVLGHAAQAVLHERICLEAQRELAYTTLSIKHIAYKLGFSDAGYFTRFFERETGQTPSRWRATAQARSQAVTAATRPSAARAR